MSCPYLAYKSIPANKTETVLHIDEGKCNLHLTTLFSFY